MKKVLCFVLVFLVVIGAIVFGGKVEDNSKYLRIHIKANSNLEVDQNVKLKVKDVIVDFLIPILANCDTKQKSVEIISENLVSIENVAESVLQSYGFDYGASAQIKNENFPTRTYGDLTLESGYYDALILNLGSGEGNNWWCVVYPPLCFVNGGNSINAFRSRIWEIIESFE